MEDPKIVHPLMIQGTASSSGKSLVAAALCRILYQDGYSVAPFKAQNMSNNSFVTKDGSEMGRAQVVQAIAAGIEPDVTMNPVLIKPSSDTGAQVVIHGRPSFFLKASQWHETRERLRKEIKKAYTTLSHNYPYVIIEGAGSPAEINLKKGDIVNMGMAKMADAPVCIVGDIDRGGVFASLVGTIQLLDDDEKKRVKGFIINKFRGDKDLLLPACSELEKITGIPVIGIIPWIQHTIDDEDGVSSWFDKKDIGGEVDICIIKLPHISNFTDFIPLEQSEGVTVRWCDNAARFGNPDLCIIPGTKSTISDLKHINHIGLGEKIITYARRGGLILGICGGFQMLGKVLRDPFRSESNIESFEGLGLLSMETLFSREKRTVQVTTSVLPGRSAIFTTTDPLAVTGYEIHMGECIFSTPMQVFTIFGHGSGRKERVNGISDSSGKVCGTYCHGLFDSAEVLANCISTLRDLKGLIPVDNGFYDRKVQLESDLDNLAQVCRTHLNLPEIYDIIFGYK